MFAGLAEFKRAIIDRIRNERQAAKAHGVKFGQHTTLISKQIDHARQLIDRDGRQVKEVATSLGVHLSTLYRALEVGAANIDS